MTLHHFRLLPLAHPDGRTEVLLATAGAVVGLVPCPDGDPTAPSCLCGFQRSPWRTAHTQRLWDTVGRNVRHVMVARPQPTGMQLTIVEDNP